MKKYVLFSSVVIFSASSLFAGNGKKSSDKTAQQAQQQTMAPASNCSQLSADEQKFSSQLNDGNKMMFCSQFTSQQRVQAMQMAGQPDVNGNMISSDQAVQQVGQMGVTQPKKRAGGGCPVK